MKTIKIKDYYGKYHDVPVSDEFFEEWHLLQNETQRIGKRSLPQKRSAYGLHR
jgi:hypothetical protein